MEKREIMFKIVRIGALHRYHIHKFASDIKMYPGQPPILEYLNDNDNCTQSELAEYLRVSAASIAVSIKRMQKAGLVEKKPDSNDLRTNRITITQCGKDFIERWRKECDRTDDKLFTGFTDAELCQLVEFLDRMRANLSSGVDDDKVFDFMHKMNKKEADE